MGRSNRKEHRQNTVGAPQGLTSNGPQGLSSGDPQGLTHRSDSSEAIPAFSVSFLVLLPFFLCPERETS